MTAVIVLVRLDWRATLYWKSKTRPSRRLPRSPLRMTSRCPVLLMNQARIGVRQCSCAVRCAVCAYCRSRPTAVFGSVALVPVAVMVAAVEVPVAAGTAGLRSMTTPMALEAVVGRLRCSLADTCFTLAASAAP